MKKLIRMGLASLAVASLFASVGKAETIKKLHSAPQLIINAASGEFNDTNEPTSSTVDLSGGDTDKCSIAVYVSSAAGTATLSLAVQISPDGGTSWIPTSTTITVSSGTSAQTNLNSNINVNPGTKLRVVPTLSSSATYYHCKVWAMPSAD